MMNVAEGLAMNKQSEQITRATMAITHLMDNCLDNLSVEELEKIKLRHRELLNYQIFWTMEKNWGRFLYELRLYANWLLEFISESENNS